MNGQTRRRAAALLEVLGVYLAGRLPMVELVRRSGVPVMNPLENLSAGITDAGLITASRQMFVVPMLQYAGCFPLIVPIDWWRRQRGLTVYGLTRAGRSWPTLVMAGLATCALSTWPVMSVSLVNSIYPSKTAPWRQAFFDMSWRRGRAVIRQVFSTGSGAACGALAVVGAGYAMVAYRIDALAYVGAGLVVLAVGLEAADRRRSRIARPVSISP
jgi:hypothetical protein